MNKKLTATINTVFMITMLLVAIAHMYHEDEMTRWRYRSAVVSGCV